MQQRLSVGGHAVLHHSAGDVVAHIWRAEGLLGFYRGIWPHILRSTPQVRSSRSWLTLAPNPMKASGHTPCARRHMGRPRADASPNPNPNPNSNATGGGGRADKSPLRAVPSKENPHLNPNPHPHPHPNRAAGRRLDRLPLPLTPISTPLQTQPLVPTSSRQATITLLLYEKAQRALARMRLA